MRVVVQKCQYSSVTVDDEVVGEIKEGLNVLVGFTQGDTLKDIDLLKEFLLQHLKHFYS